MRASRNRRRRNRRRSCHHHRLVRPAQRSSRRPRHTAGIGDRGMQHHGNGGRMSRLRFCHPRCPVRPRRTHRCGHVRTVRRSSGWAARMGNQRQRWSGIRRGLPCGNECLLALARLACLGGGLMGGGRGVVRRERWSIRRCTRCASPGRLIRISRHARRRRFSRCRSPHRRGRSKHGDRLMGVTRRNRRRHTRLRSPVRRHGPRANVRTRPLCVQHGRRRRPKKRLESGMSYDVPRERSAAPAPRLRRRRHTHRPFRVRHGLVRRRGSRWNPEHEAGAMMRPSELRRPRPAGGDGRRRDRFAVRVAHSQLLRTRHRRSLGRSTLRRCGHFLVCLPLYLGLLGWR